MRHYVLVEKSCCSGIARIEVRRIRPSEIDRRWAIVTIDGYRSTGESQGTVSVVLHRRSLGSTTWTVKELGSAVSGCGIPAAVRRELDLPCD